MEKNAYQLRLGDFGAWPRANCSDPDGDDIDTHVFSKFEPPLPPGR